MSGGIIQMLTHGRARNLGPSPAHGLEKFAMAFQLSGADIRQRVLNAQTLVGAAPAQQFGHTEEDGIVAGTRQFPVKVRGDDGSIFPLGYGTFQPLQDGLNYVEIVRVSSLGSQPGQFHLNHHPRFQGFAEMLEAVSSVHPAIHEGCPSPRFRANRLDDVDGHRPNYGSIDAFRMKSSCGNCSVR